MSDLASLSKEFESLLKRLDLTEKKERQLKLKAESAREGFWDDSEKAKSVMQEASDIEKWLKEVEAIGSDLLTLNELKEEGVSEKAFDQDLAGVKKRLETLKTDAFLSGRYDSKNAILSVYAGQGGTEAMDWASILYRMYMRYAETKGWQVWPLEVSEGEEAGIKSVTFKVVGRFAYGYLKHESGTHRLVRQSPFNADRLRQTSFAGVEVLPELAAVDAPDIKLDKDDVEWQFFRSSTQGGQNVQKVSTAVRVIHKETGIAVTAQTERSQEQNRKNALDLLRAKLWMREKARLEKEKKEIKGDYKPASWGNQIRSYVLHPYKLVKDLRTGVEVGDAQSVLEGNLEPFIKEEIKLEE